MLQVVHLKNKGLPPQEVLIGLFLGRTGAFLKHNSKYICLMIVQTSGKRGFVLREPRLQKTYKVMNTPLLKKIDSCFILTFALD